MVENIDRWHNWAWPSIPPKSTPPSPHPKQHLGQFSRFAGLTLVTNKHTNRQTTLLVWQQAASYAMHSDAA